MIALLIGCHGASVDDTAERRGVPESTASGLELIAHVEGQPGTVGNQQVTGDGAGGAWMLFRAADPVSIDGSGGGVGLALVRVDALGAVASLGMRDVDSPPVLARGEGPPVVGSWMVDWNGTTLGELASDASTVWSIDVPNENGDNPRAIVHDGTGGLYVAGSGAGNLGGQDVAGRWIVHLDASHVATASWTTDFDVTGLFPWGDAIAVAGLDGEEAVLARLDGAVSEIGRFEGWGDLEVAAHPSGVWVARSFSGQGAFFLRRLEPDGALAFDTILLAGGLSDLDLAVTSRGDAVAAFYTQADAGSPPFAQVHLFAREGYRHAGTVIDFQETGDVAVSGERAWVLLEEPFGYAGFDLARPGER